MVSNTNSKYTKSKSQWDSNRASYDGQQAIKDGTTKYLPPKGFQLKQQMTEGSEGLKDYLVFAARAIWFDATYRTVTTMQGLVFRKPPFTEGPEELDVYKEDFTVDNETIYTAAENLTKECILQGRVGLLVDYPDVDTSDMSVQDVEDAGIHSYSVVYKTENIINWKLEKVKGKLRPTLVVLKEVVDAPWGGDFSVDTTTQYRVLQLDEEGYYKQSLYFIEDPEKGLELDPLTKAYPHGEYYPLMNGKKLNFIPFYPVTPQGISWDLVRSPMEGIVNLNIGHYRNSAELEAGISLTASPTVVLSGYEAEKGKEIILGGNNALTSGNSEMRVSYLEYQGNGLKDIKEAMADKKKEMAVLGLRILASEQSINEGADTASIHQSGEQSVLSSIANSVSDALTTALRLMVKWDNPDIDTDEIKITLNKDFVPNSLTANMLNSLIVAVKSGVISDEEMFEILKSGEIIRADMKWDKHKKQLDNSMFKQLFEGEDQDFSSAVHVNRLVDPESPGDPQASKKQSADEGGSQLKE